MLLDIESLTIWPYGQVILVPSFGVSCVRPGYLIYDVSFLYTSKKTVTELKVDQHVPIVWLEMTSKLRA